MAIEAQLADGRILEFPDGTDPSVVQATVKRIVAQSATPKESTIGGELVRGGKQLVSSARTGVESLFDKNKAATEGVARSEAIAKEAGIGPSLEAVQKAYQDKGVLSAAGEAASQIPRALAGQGANLASMYAASKAGAAAGAPFGARGRIVGGAAGAAGALLPQFMGQTVETQASEQMERGEPVDINRTKAYTAAAGMAALEGAGTAFTLGKRVLKGILGVADDAALVTAKSQAELVKAAERSLAASAGRGVARGTAEIPVEVGQEIIDRYQSGQDLTSPEAIKAYGEAAYQAALIGGTLGGAAGAVGRGQARTQLDEQRRAEAQAQAAAQVPPTPEPEPEVVPGAKLPEEAPPSTQGALFTPKEMGKKVPAPKTGAAPEPETYAELTARRDELRAQEQTPEVRAELDDIAKRLAPQSEEQMGLGLDFERDYIDLFKERDRLRAEPQTPEVKARIAELSEQLASYDEADIGRRQAEKKLREDRLAKEAEQKAADEAAAQRFPGLAGPTTAAITQADIDAIGLPLKTSKQWIADNVIGKTVEEIKALVQRNPSLIANKGARAEVLKALIAPQPKAFEEKPNGPTTTTTNQPQGELDLGGGEPSVGVSGQPAGTDVVQPGAGVPATTGTPATPDGLGLAPTGQPAGKRATAKGTQPAAVTDRQQRIAFGKALGAAQSYPGMLSGRKNVSAQTAAKNGDFAGVVTALENSKNATVAEVARRAKTLRTKIQIDDTAGETYEGRSAFEDQMSIDGAKMHLAALNKLRELAPTVDKLPQGAVLPYSVSGASVPAFQDGKEYPSRLGLRDITKNNNSMFTALGLPKGADLRTKEDFKTLVDAFERVTQQIGEDKLRLTSTASAIQQGVAGQYDADTDTIRVPEYFAKKEEVLAHEIVHAQVTQAVANPTLAQRPAVQRLNKLYEHVKKVVDERAAADKNFRSPYGVASQQEFIAEGLANPDFQYMLSRIPYQASTAWDKFTEIIAKLVGIKNDNAFTELLTIYGDLNAPATTTAAPSAPAAPKTTAKPKAVAKPITTPAAPKAPQAPTPAVATETVDEEAERKREAEEFKHQMEETERKAKEARAKADAAKQAAATPPKPPAPVHPTWANSAAKKAKGVVVYSKGNNALIKYMGPDKKIAYAATTAVSAPLLSGDVSLMDPAITKRFTFQEIAELQKAKREDLKAEDDLAKKYPDGPFTNAKSNVVAGDNINPRYANYLRDLMDSLGLGDIRTFFFTAKDVENFPEKYHLHGRYTRPYEMLAEGKETMGATTRMGPNSSDFFIYLKEGLDPDLAIEIIAHELGHMIQHIAFDKASQKEKQAVLDEYDTWLAANKGQKMATVVPNLRNRRNTEFMEKGQIPDMTTDQLSMKQQQYWIGFSEWFADNVSRWATTADKPLTIAEKFFSRIAQMMRDLVALTTGRKFPPARTVAEFLENMGPGSADAWIQSVTPGGAPSVTPSETKIEFAVTFSDEQLIDSMGPLTAPEQSRLKQLVKGAQSNADIGYVTKFRTQVADIAATIEKRLSGKFDGAVRNSLGELNPMGLYRQAQDYTKMLLEYFQNGTLYKDPVTGLWKSGTSTNIRPPAEVYELIDKYAEKNGYSRERATQIASRVLEGVRLSEMRKSNQSGMTNFRLHLKDNEIDQLVRAYNADPDLQEMSKLMDEARIAMVDNLVKVGRLTKDMGDEWKSVVGYVPFDRIEDFAENYNKAKKISGKGLAQLGKLPELIGSDVRPVGNVFDNYLNTLGWMVGQTLKTDATVNTLKSLEGIGFAKELGNSGKGHANVVDAYVDGERVYWSVPSKYDVMAFKDFNPPKAGWIRAMGAFSNVLRKTVTVLPPFALKQVTDDIQRALLTSGVRNPGALIWMSLTNFPKLAFAELRGIQHPIVKEFGRLGLTGEYDFEAGKPAASLLKDLGYQKRTLLGSTILGTLVHRLDGITRASDLAVRKAIYDQTLKESKGDELLAQTRAREFINFRRRGANQFVTDMVTVIPFYNAYIQGMDVLYRAASGKDSSSSVDRAQARQMFWSRATTVIMLSSLYALGKDDEDEDYNEMDLRTRDSNWILPGGYKIPVPGELGAIFKVIPERVVEYMKRQGTPEEQTAWEATRLTLAYMFEQYLGRSLPIPQAIKPVMEAWANKSFLTGKDLEGYHHRAMDPSMRITEQTSELAKTIAVFSRDEIGVEVSPIMIDNALRGYFGSTAAMFTMVTDSLLNPTRVDRPLHKYALLSNYLYDPVGTRRMTEFYEEREKVGKANTTLNELMKTDLTRAEKYAEEHADELMLEGMVNSTLEQLERTRAYRKYLNSAQGASEMSKDDREAELKEIKKMEVEYVQWVREAKTELRKQQR